MQLQSISSQYPNVFSITQIREDIDVLAKALNEFGRVRILRGQKVFFDAVDPDYETKRQEEMKTAVDQMKSMAQKYKKNPAGISASAWLIKERDQMRSQKYHDDHNR